MSSTLRQSRASQGLRVAPDSGSFEAAQPELEIALTRSEASRDPATLADWVFGLARRLTTVAPPHAAPPTWMTNPMIEYWKDLTTADFVGLDPQATIALLPVAATEQHGPHLPLGTDLIINRGILEFAKTYLAAGIRVLVLPEQAIGDSLEHSAFPGTLSRRPELLLQLWSGIGGDVERSGLRKLLILNSHGGQVGLVDQVALRLRAEKRMLVVRANYFAFGMPPALFDSDEVRDGLHGGEIETSMMLHLRPDLVRKEALSDFSAPAAGADALLGPEKPVGYAWMSHDLNPAGTVGNALGADAERGKRLLDHLGNCLAKLIIETVAMPLEALRDHPCHR